MELVIGVVIILFVAFLLVVANKAYRQIDTPQDYLSFGRDVDETTLQKAFEGANASFATAVVSLFLYAFILGHYTFAIPLGFCIGMIFYSIVILPKKMELLAEGVRYPALLERTTGSRLIRYLVAALVVFSIWLFTLVEVQALNQFLGELFRSLQFSDLLIALTVVLVITAYVTRGGYRTIILTDKIQILVIYLGSASLLIGNLLMFSRVEGDVLWELVISYPGQIQLSPLEGGLFVIETVVGLLFSQMIYYDNWQRLSFFIRKSLELRGDDDVVCRADFLEGLRMMIARRYITGSVVLLIVYTVPIFTGYLYIAQGMTNGESSLLVTNVEMIWSILPLVGPVLSILIVLQFVSSLMSTADTYIIGATNTIYEDLMRKPFTFADRAGDKQALSVLHRIAALFSLSIMLIVWVDPDVESLFLFLYYSVNALAGPIYYAIVRGWIHPGAVVVSILFGIVYLLVPIIFSGEFVVAPLSGIVPLAASFLIVSFWKVTVIEEGTRLSSSVDE